MEPLTLPSAPEYGLVATDLGVLFAHEDHALLGSTEVATASPQPIRAEAPPFTLAVRGGLQAPEVGSRIMALPSPRDATRA